jgi:hypothetical protein
MRAERRIDPILICNDVLQEQYQAYTKLNFSIEKKIERLWQDSEKQGWKFNQFVSVTLEVLTILHHRNRLRLAEQAPVEILQAKRALS